MLSLISGRRSQDCEGTTRRDFLRVGTLGLGSLTLADLMRSRATAAKAGTPTRNTSVIWVWLSGGPTHVETFDPKRCIFSRDLHEVSGVRSSISVFSI